MNKKLFCITTVDQFTDNINVLLLFMLWIVVFKYKLLCIQPQLFTKLRTVDHHLTLVNKFLPQHRVFMQTSTIYANTVLLLNLPVKEF